MNKGWKTVKLGDVVEIIGGGTPNTSTKEYWNGDIPWISIKDFRGDTKYILTTEKTITNLGLNNSSTNILQNGDIIISARGTVGELAQIVKPMAFNQSCYGLRVNFPRYLANFLFYVMKISINELKNNAHGSVFDTITTNTLKSLCIPLPPLAEQERIASILSAFDDKIETNRKICADLEAAAKLLFRKNFIAHPDRDSWEEVRLGDVAEITMGQSPKGEYLDIGGKYPFLQGSSEFTEKFPDIVRTSTIITRQANKDDILLSVRAPVGMLNIAPIDNICIGRGLAAIKGKKYCHFVYYTLESSKKIWEVYNSTGTVFGSISRKELESLSISLAPQDLLETFEKTVTPMFEQIKNLQLENRTLAQARDLLLPRLMRGER